MRAIDHLSPKNQLEICKTAEVLVRTGMSETEAAVVMGRGRDTIRLALVREAVHGSCRECGRPIVQYVRVTEQHRYHKCSKCAERAWAAVLKAGGVGTWQRR